MEEKFDLSLILACYNEGPIFKDSVGQIFSVLDQSNFSYEVIFIDDHSGDKTREKIKEIIKENPRKRLRAFYHRRNKGRGRTVTEGFLKARGKVVGFIDVDLEIPADYLPRFVNAVFAGNDVATAFRIYDFNLRSLPRWLASKGYRWLRKLLLEDDFQDTESGYKFFNHRKILKVLKKCHHSGWFWDTEVMIRSAEAGLKVKEIPVVFIKNPAKESTVRLLPDSWNYLVNLWRFRKREK